MKTRKDDINMTKTNSTRISPPPSPPNLTPEQLEEAVGRTSFIPIQEAEESDEEYAHRLSGWRNKRKTVNYRLKVLSRKIEYIFWSLAYKVLDNYDGYYNRKEPPKHSGNPRFIF